MSQWWSWRCIERGFFALIHVWILSHGNKIIAFILGINLRRQMQIVSDKRTSSLRDVRKSFTWFFQPFAMCNCFCAYNTIVVYPFTFLYFSFFPLKIFRWLLYDILLITVSYYTVKLENILQLMSYKSKMALFCGCCICAWLCSLRLPLVLDESPLDLDGPYKTIKYYLVLFCF